MAAAKKKPKAKKKRASSLPAPLARSAPPDVYAPVDAGGDDDRIYIRVPLAPHVVTAFREHAANGARLLELVTGAETDVASIFEHIAKTATALERDLVKVRARAARRRR